MWWEIRRSPKEESSTDSLTLLCLPCFLLSQIFGDESFFTVNNTALLHALLILTRHLLKKDL